MTSTDRILTIAFAIILITGCSTKKQPGLYASMTAFQSDGVSGGTVLYIPDLPRAGEFSGCTIKDGGAMTITAVTDEAGGKRYYFKSTGKPGRAVFTSPENKRLVLYFAKPGPDSDADGFPDKAELQNESDRRAFRKWFVRIAESQYEAKTPAWEESQQDCAGLVRMAYREALKRHDRDWCRRFGFVPDGNIPDISAFSYPNIPVLCSSIFRVKDGAPDKSSFGPFADAATLLSLNTEFIGKDLSAAEPGDILFYENRGNMYWPYHSMIMAGIVNNEHIVVYHTGKGGIVKRAEISYLRASREFNPVPENPDFLGIYRFKILE